MPGFVTAKIGEGKMLDHAHTAAVEEGEVLQVVKLLLVASRPAAANELIGWHTEGLFSFPKTAGGATAIPKGTVLYWDNVAFVVTTTVGTNVKIGHASKASVDADVVQQVRLQQMG